MPRNHILQDPHTIRPILFSFFNVKLLSTVTTPHYHRGNCMADLPYSYGEIRGNVKTPRHGVNSRRESPQFERTSHSHGPPLDVSLSRHTEDHRESQLV